jgi:hypothetical protein
VGELGKVPQTNLGIQVIGLGVVFGRNIESVRGNWPGVIGHYSMKGEWSLAPQKSPSHRRGVGDRHREEK